MAELGFRNRLSAPNPAPKHSSVPPGPGSGGWGPEGQPVLLILGTASIRHQDTREQSQGPHCQLKGLARILRAPGAFPEWAPIQPCRPRELRSRAELHECLKQGADWSLLARIKLSLESHMQQVSHEKMPQKASWRRRHLG